MKQSAPRISLLCLVGFLFSPDSGFADEWAPPGIVATEPDGMAFGNPQVVVSRSDGSVNVFWARSTSGPNSVQWCHSSESGWTEPRTVFEIDRTMLKLDAVQAESGEFWVAWHSHLDGNLREIVTIRGQGEDWSDPIVVNQEPGRKNWNPKLGSNGGRTWIAWYSELETPSGNLSDIYIEEWLGSEWGVPVRLTSMMPGYHWFVDLAVDSKGRPHLVWGDSSASLYNYVTLDGETWTEPFQLNPLLLGVAAAGWPGCSITVDAEDRPHIAWTGMKTISPGGIDNWDIYYSGFDGTFWNAPIPVSSDDDSTDAYPIIMLRDPGQLWITWFAGNPASLDPYHVDVATLRVEDLQGKWNTWRLDDDNYLYDSGSTLFIRPGNQLGVLWHGNPPLASPDPGAHVLRYFNDADVPVVAHEFAARAFETTVELTWRDGANAFAAFEIERLSGTAWLPLATLSGGSSPYRWSESGLPAGRHTYRLVGISRDGSPEVLGRTELEVGMPPDRLVVRVAGDAASGPILMLGLSRTSAVMAHLHDVQGRHIESDDLGHLDAGWHSLPLASRLRSGRGLASGVYLIRVSTGSEEQAVKLVVSR